MHTYLFIHLRSWENSKIHKAASIASPFSGLIVYSVLVETTIVSGGQERQYPPLKIKTPEMQGAFVKEE